MVTPFTAASNRLKLLDTAKSATIIPAKGLAEAVERHIFNGENGVETLLKNILQTATFDNLVLGCTHYCFLKDIIKRNYPKVTLFDGNIGVAKRVSFFAKNYPGCPPNLCFKFTADTPQGFKSVFNCHVFDNSLLKKLAIGDKVL